jgi:Flp pilus assembly pilin Flp
LQQRRIHRFCHMSVSKGQSLAEYGMVIGLVAAVGIAAVALLGGSLQDGLANINGGNATPSTLAITDAPPGGVSSPGGTSGLSTLIPPPGTGQEQICFQSGYCANIPVIDGTTVTTGANGGQMTHQFADVLSQIALQLQADPNADPTLLSLITELANRGHNVGGAEQQFFDSCSASCDSPTLSTFSGVLQLSRDRLTQQSVALQNYLNDKPDMLPQELQSLIYLQVDQIYQLQTPFLNVAARSQPYDLNTMPITLTHQSANTICGSGGDTGVCVQPVASAGS